MTRTILFLAAVAVCLLGVPARAGSYFVKPLTAVGISKDDQLAVDEVLRTAVAQESQAAPATSAKGAAGQIDARLVRLGQAYILTLSKIRPDGSAFTQKARAPSLEDLDQTIERLVRATLREVAMKDDGLASDVTADEETRGTRRREVVRQWVFGLGPSAGTNLASSGAGVAWSLGYTWGIDERFGVRANFDWGSFNDAKASYADFQLGGDYYFLPKEPNLFVTGDFGYGSATINSSSNSLFSTPSDSVSGFTFSAGAGVRWFRTSRVNLGTTLKYTIWANSNSRGTPGVTTLLLAIYF